MAKSKKTKRKARETIDKDIDPTTPLDFSLVGSDDDPCFGKHFSLTAPECKRCGDAEYCQIVAASNQHFLRDKIEKKQAFKDIEEVELVKANQKLMVSFYKKLSKKLERDYIRITRLSRFISKKIEWDEEYVTRLVNEMVNIGTFKLHKNKKSIKLK